MHNIIDSPTITSDVKGKSMTKFASKQRSKWSQLHFTCSWNMNILIALESFIVKGKVHKVITIILHTIQWPKQQVFMKLNPKLFLILVMITLHWAWLSFFLSMPYILKELWCIPKLLVDSNVNPRWTQRKDEELQYAPWFIALQG
jgi:hypothetical protein